MSSAMSFNWVNQKQQQLPVWFVPTAAVKDGSGLNTTAVKEAVKRANDVYNGKVLPQDSAIVLHKEKGTGKKLDVIVGELIQPTKRIKYQEPIRSDEESSLNDMFDNMATKFPLICLTA